MTDNTKPRCRVCGGEEDAPMGDDFDVTDETGTVIRTHGQILHGECLPCRLGKAEQN